MPVKAELRVILMMILTQFYLLILKTKYSLIVFFDGFNFYSLALKTSTHTNTSTPNLEFLYISAVVILKCTCVLKYIHLK